MYIIEPGSIRIQHTWNVQVICSLLPGIDREKMPQVYLTMMRTFMVTQMGKG